VAYATSAVRSASNGDEFCEFIRQSSGINLKPLSGLDEAKLIHEAVVHDQEVRGKKYLIVDIGGGSTEIGLGHGKISDHLISFPLGTVRLLDDHRQLKISAEAKQQIRKMQLFIQRYAKDQELDLIIGTGGNLRRLGKLKRKIYNNHHTNELSQKELHEISELILKLNYQERIRLLDLKEDRADVIAPACYILNQLDQVLPLKKIHLPDIGLKDGMLYHLMKKHYL
jgi:exopolyphosphatase/guanosine-5'-triphosphate,3'-diphosphate pyrophosphatase